MPKQLYNKRFTECAHSRKHKERTIIEAEESKDNQTPEVDNLTEDSINTYGTTDDLIVSIDGIWRCVVCNKQSNRNLKGDLAAHVETHMAGLSYKCKFCPTIMKSRGARNSHVYRKHSAQSAN